MHLDTGELSSINAELQTQSPEQRITYFLESFGESFVMTTSFGEESAIMLDLAARICPDIPVIYVDHGCWREPSLQNRFVERCIRRFSLNLFVVRPQETINFSAVFDALEQPALLESLKYIGKKEPLKRALKYLGASAWMSGVSRHETTERQTLEIFMENGAGYKLHPIVDLDTAQRDSYISSHGLLRNTDYFDIFKGLHGKLECGLHTDIGVNI